MAVIAFKNLKKTDIEKRLTIPSKNLHRFPPLSGKHTVDFPVIDDNNRVWVFRIYTRKKSSRYLKPVITKGWREFVCIKQLTIGDRIVFSKEKDQAGGVKYRVKVEKAVKIFGTVFRHPSQDV